MASWDSPVVSSPSTASYGAPLVNFDELGKLPETYLKMKEMKRQDDVANAFRAGIPKDASGNFDYPSMAETMLKLGNYPEATTLQNTGIEMQRMRNGQKINDQYFTPTSGAAGPGQPAPTSTAPGTRSQQPPAATAPPTVMTILNAQGVPNDQLQAASESLSRQLGVGPNDVIDTKDPQVANVLRAAIPRLKTLGQVVQDPSAVVSTSQATPAQRVSQGFSDANIPAHGVPDGSQAPLPTRVADTAQSLGMPPKAAAAFQSKLDAMSPAERKATLSNWATNPAVPKSLSEFAEKRLESIERGEEPTTEIKNAGYDAASGGALTRHEATLAGAKEEATAPYHIAANAIREGARPVAVKPNEVVTTGAQLDPALTGFTDWASKRMGVPSGAPAAPAPAPIPAPQGAPRPGTLPTAPSPPLAPTSVAPNPDQSGRSAFTPQLVRNPDGSVASTVTPSTETMQKNAATNYEKARETYGGAQEVQNQLAGMEDAARTLNKSNWSSTGTGGNARLALAKTVDGIWQTLGVKDQNLPFDPDAVASWEKLTKETTRLGFGLARTLGAREAMQIVQGAIKANPNVENTPEGFRMVLNSIRQNAERQSDYFEYATNYAQTHGGDLVGAEVQARKDIPQEAVEALRNDPSSAPAFDDHYGTKGLAKMFLGNARPGTQ
jgi:hypothetical protein